MKIQKTGLHMVGEGRLRVMVLGGAGVGKTRWASYWPRPFYAATEEGLLSVADREVPYVDIETSKDMLDFLQFCKREGRKPRSQWGFETVVIDTLDSYQRKLKAEWVERNRAEGFTGWEAWDFLEQKMQQCMTRLLNLPFNVVVLVHIKDTKVKVGEDEQIVHGIRISGGSRDWVVDDFDLIGRMGFFYEAGRDGRVKKRGLTFDGDESWPDVKDRLYFTPEWLEVDFEDPDADFHGDLLATWRDRVDAMKEAGVADNSTDVQEHDVVDPDEDGGDAPPKTDKVVEEAAGGPVPETVPKGVPFDQLRRTDLIKLARSVPDLAEKVKGNTTKGVLAGMLEKHRDDHASEWSDDGRYVGQTLEAAATEATKEEQETTEDSSTDVQEEKSTDEAPEEADATTEGDVPSEPEPADDTTGGSADDYDRTDDDVCSTAGCTPDLPGTPENIKRLSKIKFRRRLCGTDEGCFKNCYQATKDSEDGRTVPEGLGWAGQYIS